MTRTCLSENVITDLPAAALQSGHWILTYAPRAQRPRWHRVTNIDDSGHVRGVALANRTSTAGPFIRSYSPTDRLTVATTPPGPDPDLVRIAQPILTVLWPETWFGVTHMPGGLHIAWADGPTSLAVQAALSATDLVDYQILLGRGNSPALLALWLIRTFPETDPRRLRRLSSLPKPTFEIDIPPPADAVELRMVRALCGITSSEDFHQMKMTYAALGYGTLAGIAA